MIYHVIKKIEWTIISIYNILISSYLFPFYFKNKKYIKKITPLEMQSDKSECFIVLGGLSALELNFSKLSNKDVFTVNHFFRNDIWDVIKPKYHIVIDNNFFKNPKNTDDLFEKCGSDVQLFLNGRYLKDYRENVFPIFPIYRYAGSIKWISLEKPQINFSTVALQTIYIAVILGYTNINLIGFDLPPGHMPHFYKDSDVEIEGEKTQQAKVDEYSYCNLFWQYTNCHHEAYGLARFCKKNKVKVFNMSDSSFVRAFEHKEFNFD